MTRNDQPASPAPPMSEQTTAAGVDVAALVRETCGKITGYPCVGCWRCEIIRAALDTLIRAQAVWKEDTERAGEVINSLKRTQAEQQAEIARLTGINSKLCNNHNELLIDGTKWQHRAEAVAAERDALKAERDTLAQENATLRQQVGDWRFRYEQTEPSEGA
jgi:hypothetical protein